MFCVRNLRIVDPELCILHVAIWCVFYTCSYLTQILKWIYIAAVIYLMFGDDRTADEMACQLSGSPPATHRKNGVNIRSYAFL